MKLVVAGASGFVASETIKQALVNPAITSLITLSRKAVAPPQDLPSGTPTSKLQNVVVDDYENYSPEVLKHLDGADACIWTIAVLPPKPFPFSNNASTDIVRKVSVGYAVNGLKTIYSVSHKPFRFIYISGHAAQRDRNVAPNAPGFMKEYCWIRGEAENELLDLKTKNGGVSVTVVKPGLISPAVAGLKTMAQSLLGWAVSVPVVSVREVAATMIARVTTGEGEGDTVRNEELVEEGKKALEAQKM